MRGGRPLLKVLLLQHRDLEMWTPIGWFGTGRELSPALLRILGIEDTRDKSKKIVSKAAHHVDAKEFLEREMRKAENVVDVENNPVWGF